MKLKTAIWLDRILNAICNLVRLSSAFLCGGCAVVTAAWWLSYYSEWYNGLECCHDTLWMTTLAGGLTALFLRMALS